MNPNQNARRLAVARQRQARLQMQTLHTIVAETRDDVRRLKHALQAVLHHMAGDQSGRTDGNQPSRQPHPGDRRDSTVEAAGGSGEQEIDDAAFRHALDCGLPAPLEVYRRAYATVGVPWPGDEQARRLHPISDDGPQAPTCPSVQQLSWQSTTSEGRPPRSRTDTQRPESGSRSDDKRPAAQRLADALGWDHVPQLSEAEQKESDLDLQAAQVQARRIYQQETGEFETWLGRRAGAGRRGGRRCMRRGPGAAVATTRTAHPHWTGRRAGRRARAPAAPVSSCRRGGRWR